MFECAATQGRPVTLTPFPDSGLSGLTVAADGDVYGFCSYHGLTADGNISPGTVFRIAADGGRYDAVDTLATFPSALPVEPSAGPPVVDAAGDVFGVFAVNHDLFELPAGSAALELAAPFAHSATAIDVGRLSVDSAGDVYGTTVEQAGTFRDQFGGSAFEIPAGTDFSTLDTVDTVATITVATDAVPSGPLLIRPDGVLVGTVTPYLSLGSVGTVFEAGGPAAPVAATTTTLSAAIPVVDAGAADTFTAAVSPQPAGGSVTFVSTTAGGPRVTLGTAALAADGTATFTTTLTTSANAEQTVVAVYGGDAADAPSTSAATAVGVVAAPTVTTLTLTAPISFGIGTVGQPQQLAATLDYANVVLPTQPTGTVTFYAGTTLPGHGRRLRLLPDGHADHVRPAQRLRRRDGHLRRRRLVRGVHVRHVHHPPDRPRAAPLLVGTDAAVADRPRRGGRCQPRSRPDEHHGRPHQRHDDGRRLRLERRHPRRHRLRAGHRQPDADHPRPGDVVHRHVRAGPRAVDLARPTAGAVPPAGHRHRTRPATRTSPCCPTRSRWSRRPRPSWPHSRWSTRGRTSCRWPTTAPPRPEGG